MPKSQASAARRSQRLADTKAAKVKAKTAKTKKKASPKQSISKVLRTSQANGNSIPQEVAEVIINKVEYLAACFNALDSDHPSRLTQLGAVKNGFRLPSEFIDHVVKLLQTKHKKYSGNKSTKKLRIAISKLGSGIGKGVNSGTVTSSNLEKVNEKSKRRYDIVKAERHKNNRERIDGKHCFFFLFFFFFFFSFFFFYFYLFTALTKYNIIFNSYFLLFILIILN